MPFFTFPFAFAGVAAVAGLVAVYWLRNRSRRRVVSSLMLWTDQKRPHQGGRIVQWMQAPLLFFLELVAIALLILAAAGPMLRAAAAKPIIVVLDDSYSMRAGGENSPREQARKAVVEMFRRDKYVGRFILAGRRPQLLGRAARSAGQAEDILKQWTCTASRSDLQQAITLAGELTGRRGRILVLGDHRPPMEMDRGRIEWHGFGRPRANFAFVNAVCADHDGRQRVLLEIANLSDTAAATTLTISGGPLATPQPQRLSMAAGATERVVFELPTTKAALTATLSDDALEIDNSVTLLPQQARPVRVAVQLATNQLRSIVQKALAATKLSEAAGRSPQLLITDRPAPAAQGPDHCWRLELLADGTNEQSAAYAGPFVLDRSHPLTEGLSLAGVIWAADPNRQPAGRPVIMAGNVVLLADAEHLEGRHDLRMQFQHQLSTLHDSAAWPIFFHNLLRWRASAAPGVVRPNVRLGWQASLVLPGGITEVKLTRPGEKARTVAVHDRRLTVEADRVGVYHIAAEDGQNFSFACNAISREESDLAGATSGVWGDWDESDTFGHEYVSIAFAAALLAMAALIAHQVLLARIGGGPRP